MAIPEPPVPMPVERPTTVYLNDIELLTIQTTPICLEDWALGFLYVEGFIDGPGDLLKLVIDEDRGQVWADVRSDSTARQELSGKRYMTSGCGKGVTFSSVKDAAELRPVTHELRVSREQLLDWMKLMYKQTPLYLRSGGMHSVAAVHVPTGEMIVREDIGRHNAADKVIGALLRNDWSGGDTVILTSGRISYEMCTKLARTGIGIGASRTAATDQAYRLAMLLGIDLVGYVRSPSRLVVYTSGERIS